MPRLPATSAALSMAGVLTRLLPVRTDVLSGASLCKHCMSKGATATIRAQRGIAHELRPCFGLDSAACSSSFGKRALRSLA